MAFDYITAMKHLLKKRKQLQTRLFEWAVLKSPELLVALM